MLEAKVAHWQGFHRKPKKQMIAHMYDDKMAPWLEQMPDERPWADSENKKVLATFSNRHYMWIDDLRQVTSCLNESSSKSELLTT